LIFYFKTDHFSLILGGNMPPDLWSLYGLMLRSRLYEEAIAQLWREGLISGEMHLGTGEEAIIAGVLANLQAGDAMALDHRGTAALLMRGVDPVQILCELLGCANGLCRGMGGHMHLFSKEHLAASSGIVGAVGPMAAGFALSAQYLRPEAIAVAFFGEGAMNQGMLMESMNLASAWKLPVLFVCKDDNWSIATQSQTVTGGDLNERARGLGIEAIDVDGRDVVKVWETAHSVIERIRSGEGPTFMHTRCVHFEGHFLGFQLIRLVRDPLKEMAGTSLSLTGSFLHPGGSTLPDRLAGLNAVLGIVRATSRDPRRDSTNDPIIQARLALRIDPPRLQELEENIKNEVNQMLATALGEMQP
jgi:acetoin:2,6-dichlorophenolindophenol oxidoreductase subunit alpha